MTLSTSALRREWAPHCPPPSKRATVDLYGGGRVNVLVDIVPAVLALNACLEAHGYRTRRADTGAYNCRQITGGTGYSLHAFAIAVDINWQSNPYGPRLVTDMPRPMVEAIKAIRTNSGAQVWRWGGDYRGNRDAMHFEVVCTRADIASGIAGTIPNPDEEFDMDEDRLRQIIREEVAPVNTKLDRVNNGLTTNKGLLEGLHGKVDTVRNKCTELLARVKS